MNQSTFSFNKNFSASQLEAELRNALPALKIQVYQGDGENSGVIVIPQELTEQEWQSLYSTVNEHGPFNPVPESIGPAQLRIALRRLHGITKTQLEGVVNAVFAQIPNEDERQDAKDLWEYASIIERGHPLVSVVANYFGLTEAQIDEVFRQGVLI